MDISDVSEGDEIEVGDKVRIVSRDNYPDSFTPEVGTEHTIESISGKPSDGSEGLVVDLNCWGGSLINTRDLELISKGEDTMENNGIAFKVENENLLGALVDELEEIGIEINGNVYFKDGPYYYFGADENYEGGDTLSCLSYKKSYCENENFKILQFPQDWNEIIEYFEENAKPDKPKIETEHGPVEFYDDHIEVGCKTILNETIEQVYESLDKLANVVTTSRNIQLIVRGAEFTMKEIEEIAEYQL